MKVRLLFSDRDAEIEPTPMVGADQLIEDLDLMPMLDTMIPHRELPTLCRDVVLRPLDDPRQILWRQRVMADALADPSAFRELFDLAGRGLESQNQTWLWSGRDVDSLLSKAVHGLRATLPLLGELASFAGRKRPNVRSAGMVGLCQRLSNELDADYLDQIAALLTQLEFPEGTASRSRIDDHGLAGHLELLGPRGRRSWREALWTGQPGSFRFTIPDRDEAGSRALADLRADAIYQVAITLSEANDHVVGFLRQLRWEVGFYVGCGQLFELLRSAGVRLCWPDPQPSGDTLSAAGLVSPSVAVRTRRAPTPNDLPGPRLPLTIVTGANQGGKTTFLRSLGVAQLMLQSGMFVTAAAYRSGVAGGVHTHFRTSEEASLRSGKLDEELTRMSAIVDRCRPGDLLLMNESFASTDEVEGSYIAGEIIDALLAFGVRIVLVTHFHALAQRYRGRAGATFLQAERMPDGSRSYRMLPGNPESTSHALDIFGQLFGDDPITPGPCPAVRTAVGREPALITVNGETRQ